MGKQKSQETNNKRKMRDKATIETLINTAALALTTFGVTEILNHDYYGFVLILFAMMLEFSKYYGRYIELW